MDVVFHNPTEGCVSLNIGLNESCTDIQIYQYSQVENKGTHVIIMIVKGHNVHNHETCTSPDDCRHFDSGRGIVTYFLAFVSPSQDNTGEYICSDSDKSPGSSIYIAVGMKQ